MFTRSTKCWPRALLAVGQAFYIPAGLAFVADLHGSATRSRATGLHMSGLYAGVALSGLGGLVAEHCGWRNAFSWFGLAGVAYAGVLSWFLHDRREAGANEITSAPVVREGISLPQALRALFGQTSFLALLAYSTLFALANWGINGWLPTYLRERFSLGVGPAGISATGWIQAASFVGVLLGGAWSDRWARRNSRGRLYVPFIGLCVGGPFVCLLARTDAFAVAILGMSVYGLGRGLADAGTMPILCQLVGPRYRATGYGFLNLFSAFAGGMMIYAGGALRDYHINISKAFQLAAAGLVIAGLALLAVRPNSAKEENQVTNDVATPRAGQIPTLDLPKPSG